MSDEPRKPLMRSLGEFVGHVARGLKSDPTKGGEGDGRRRVETGRRTETRTTEDGIVLRRTTIEEVELPDGRWPEAGDTEGGDADEFAPRRDDD